MKRIASLLLCLTAGLTVARAAQRVQGPQDPQAETIYGDDDRLDLYQEQDPRLRALADSTVALFRSDSVKLDAAAGVCHLSLESYAQSNNLCAQEPFSDQKDGAFCSGSLVGPNLVATAGHCVTSSDDCQGVKFVFGFAIAKAGGATPDTVPSGEVYGCKELVARQEEYAGADWALIRLDRPVTNHQVLQVNRGAGVTNGEKLVMIGYPSGLPVKIAGGNTNVLDASPNGWFRANTDSYHGNSGSAVFSQQTGLIEGILVRGDDDYVPFTDANGHDAGCYVSKKCPADATGCRGEDVTKISSVQWPASNAKIAQLLNAKTPSQSMISKPGPAFAELIDQANAARSN